MQRILKLGAVAIVTIGAVAGVTAVTMPDASASSSEWGCPRGDVCIYTQKGWLANKPEHKYYTYGVHQLHHEYKTHWVFNNQYGGAKATLNTGWTGGGVKYTIKAGDTHIDEYNLSPINSITLKP